MAGTRDNRDGAAAAPNTVKGKPAAPPMVGQAPSHDARTLLAGQREAVILLDGEPYRLRITAKEKLILTK